MPWRLRWVVYMVVLGAIALALSIIVLVRDTSLDTELLATLGLVGALAMIINSLPRDGDAGDEPRPRHRRERDSDGGER